MLLSDKELLNPGSSGDIARSHPSRNLRPRSNGFGIGGGYERPYTKTKKEEKPAKEQSKYGPLPHSGYYGSSEESLRFQQGEASFKGELALYKSQYGEATR